jgi:hypothetical protein
MAVNLIFEIYPDRKTPPTLVAQEGMVSNERWRNEKRYNAPSIARPWVASVGKTTVTFDVHD